jgi:putative redox protein
MLAGTLDYPSDKVRAFMIFAHCFTCTKDFPAASRICRGLAEKGFGVLRFDFSGLGASEGNFADTNFSSNIEDLKAAAAFLENNYKPPKVLVGHSLGGVAVLAVGEELETVEGVVTIAAPSDLSHLRDVMGTAAKEAMTTGEGHLNVAGREYVIKKQFFEDLDHHQQSGTARSFHKALLVLHPAEDQLVEVEHAKVIKESGRGASELVLLEGADHTLSRPEYTNQAVDAIDGWAERVLEL